MTTLAWQLILQVVLIALNAIFACAEIAVISAKDAKIAALAQEGNRRAIRLERLTSQPARFLATIQVSITLAGFLGSAFAADNFSEALVDWMISLGVKLSPQVLDTIAVVLITLILSYFTLIFGELVPKRLAMKNAEKLALAVSGLVTVISVVFKPIVSLLTASTNGMLRLLRVDPDSEEDVYSEEEIRMMATAGSQQGTIGEEENEFIQNLFEFDDQRAEEFATHRTKMSVLWADGSTDDWEREIFSSRHSLYPVCRDTTDKVVGILDIKDYFALPERSAEAAMSQAVKEPYFVPDSIKADVLFKRMRDERIRIAVVLDEYGGVTGIVTLSDILELLVGDLNGCDETAEGDAN
ncbi:MAG TPA: HlyC/CorC family transporter [Candidatus Scatomorpha merdavium]|nr:HlyC/CorC family transporter [Candidatus Scatomorpha merdavium]